MAGKHIVLVGGSGAVGTVLRRGLDERFVVIDTERPSEMTRIDTFIRGAVSDAPSVLRALEGAKAAIHLATGAPHWDSLLDTDMIGLKILCEGAVSRGVPCVVYASSSHVVGMVERDAHRSGAHSPYPVGAPDRPDSLYGVAKSFGETLCRFYAENTPLRTSCVRIGTVRLDDDLDACSREPYFDYIPGGRPAILARLERTWLSHADLIRMFQDELDARDKFRLRFGISGTPSPYWSTEVLTWSPEDV